MSSSFQRLDLTRAVHERFREGRAWCDTDFYARIVRDIEAGTPKWGCATREQFEMRLREDVEGLYERIRTDGFRSQAELGRPGSRDDVRIAITREGRLMFVDGKHRLAIAQVLDLDRIPARVTARHVDWWRFRSDLEQRAATGLRGRIYQAIDHPDLHDLPAHKEWDRDSLLADAVADVRRDRGPLLDLGAHWGHVSQRMAELGFDVVAVESNPEHAAIASKLSIATEANYGVWTGSLYDYPHAEKANVVLALNLFHHLIKTRRLHRGLVRFLRRLTCEVIVFEPHLPHRAREQMRGAYRNYEPEEFARFVASNAGLNTVKALGAANDERPLFKLSR